MSKTNFSTADQISFQLEKCTEELVNSLILFQNTRAATIQAQNHAFSIYEEEMRALDGLNENDEDSADHIPLVDHNIMRHLNTSNKIVLDDDNCQIEEDQETNDSASSIKDSVKGSNRKKSKKPDPPTFLERSKAREILFDVLEESKTEEMKLEIALSKAKEEESENLHEIKEALFAIQKRNAERLKDMIAEYNPSPSVTVWGNDPDYVSMVKNLEQITSEANLITNSKKLNKMKPKRDLFKS